MEKANELLELAGLSEGEVLYDLGCGKGNILIAGAENFSAKCVGIEKDKKLVKEARRKVKVRRLEGQIDVLRGDILSPEYWMHLGGGEPHAIAHADVVAIYLNFEIHEAIVPMLEKELKHGARVVSHEFFVRGWKPVKELPMLFAFQKGKSF